MKRLRYYRLGVELGLGQAWLLKLHLWRWSWEWGRHGRGPR